MKPYILKERYYRKIFLSIIFCGLFAGLTLQAAKTITVRKTNGTPFTSADFVYLPEDTIRIIGGLMGYGDFNILRELTTNYHLVLETPNTELPTYGFGDCRYLISASFPNILRISDICFINNINLRNVHFPELRSFMLESFWQCTSLTEVEFPKAVIVNSKLFLQCTNLTTASFPVAFTIDYMAFMECQSLTYVSIPKATRIQNQAFSDCKALSGLVLGVPPAIENSTVFKNVSALLLAVPDSTAYTAAVLADYPAGTEAFNTSITTDSGVFRPGGSVTLIPNRIPTLTGGSYQWKKDGTIIAGATSTTYKATSKGLYTLQYIRGNLSVPLLSTRLFATPYDLNGAYNRYQQCDDHTLQLNFAVSIYDRTVEVWSEDSGAPYVLDANTGKYFKDIQTYKLPAGETTLTIPYKINEDVDDASHVTFAWKVSSGGNTEYTDTYTLYAAPEIKLVKYTLPTTLFKGVLEISISNGSYYIQRSLDGGQSWQYARDTITGAILPFSQSQIANFIPGSTILFRQPDGCSYEELTVGTDNDGNGSSPINRLVTMPQVTDAITTVEAGRHYVTSGSNFSFTITPTGDNAGKSLHVSTSRTSVPDSEGVQIVNNSDGSYTVTILSIRETVTIAIDFATGIDSIDGNAVWSHANQLYIRSEETGEAVVYTLQGALVSNIRINAGETVTLQLSNGVYVITLNGKTYKIVAG